MDKADREGPHFCWRIIPFLIGHQLNSQSKVELPNTVVAGIFGTHQCKYLTD